MTRTIATGFALSALLIGLQAGTAASVSAQAPKVLSEKTLTDFKFPESVGCDAEGKVLYVSEFGSELKPTQKDGKGRISKVSLDGKILERALLLASGDVLNKPKGIWIKGDRLWTTDIDSVWVFDLKSKKGRKVELPGIQFANDPTILGDALYVSDNRGDQLYRVVPADFLAIKDSPKVTVVFSGKSINPNGIYPGKDGSLLMGGFVSDKEPRGIYSMAPGGEPKTLVKDAGRVDGLYQMQDGGLLATDWNSGTLFYWDAAKGMQTLASGFKGPADLCAMPNDDGLLVAVPDLVKSEVRLFQLGK